MTDHLNALDYEFLTNYFKCDTDIDVFYCIDKIWRFIEVESLFDNEDEMTEEEIAALKMIN